MRKTLWFDMHPVSARITLADIIVLIIFFNICPLISLYIKTLSGTIPGK